ncbi:hypothetical protein DM02DRAFT_571886 [Periconia macrospinosa]|uniref:ER membrane protein complex subunit 2 n=1 Tax=Periconia macrospinosa TaxID=97972 RepID=A0A2V1DCS1_9PLEO|nr:hypothetical protein DM02DRAFT_571886 [Periconia macrospinosa]
MATSNLLSPPAQITPNTALKLSQKAPIILSSSPTSSLPWPLSLLFSRETPETWTIHENLLLAALRTGDDASARQVLDRLTSRFGESNERIIALRGIYEEALAKDDKELTKILDGYGKVLESDPTNIAVRKRGIAVMKSLGKTAEAIASLRVLLDNSPTDVEGWAEMSDMYASIGSWGQAIYCLEEVLLMMPNAWSAHAQIATLHYLSAPASVPSLSMSLRHFARSVELNESYLRGYYGLKLVSKKLLPLLSETPSNSKRNDEDDVPPPKLQTVKKLEELATGKLAEIIREYKSGNKKWAAFDEAEVIAARELLDRDDKTER